MKYYYYTEHSNYNDGVTRVEATASRPRPELFEVTAKATIFFVLEPSSMSRTVLLDPVPGDMTIISKVNRHSCESCGFARRSFA